MLQRKAGQSDAQAVQGPVTDYAVEEMPDNMSVVEVLAILGERCCVLRKLKRKQRRGGPAQAYSQQFLVRGTFMEDDDSDDEGECEEEVPEPDTYWVDQEVLLATIQVEDVKRRWMKRHERVLSGLKPPRRGRAQ